MNVASSTNLIEDFVLYAGGGIFSILTSVIGLAVAYMVFKFGWRKLKSILNESEYGEIYSSDSMDTIYRKRKFFGGYTYTDMRGDRIRDQWDD